MKILINIALAGVLGLVCMTQMSCVPSTLGQQGGVSIEDPDSRSHLQTRLTMADYKALAEDVTNKMLRSHLVQSWGSWKPKLIVGDLVNHTNNENIRMSDLHDRIQEVIFNSGLIRVVDKSATSFDYIVKTELTSTRQHGGGQELAYYTMQMKMFTLSGELKGQWSADLHLARTS
ncbi:MAG: hypothetical protein U5L00_01085 [Desulfovermiculus sp.]|nr:hypothetical protein [Desulfovermiculus sp.]